MTSASNYDLRTARLTYVSKRTPLLSDDEIVELALDANRANRQRDITGCLWFSDRGFFQVLEGPYSVLASLFASIRNDARHAEVRLLTFQHVPDRLFARWNLAHVHENQDQNMSELIHHYAGVDLPPSGDEPTVLRTILNRMLDLLGRNHSTPPEQA